MDRSRSRAAFERAKKLIPGGVNSPARAFGAVGGEPPFIARGEGPFLIDIDGNRYLDYIGSWGPLILGHSHPRVVEAVEKALRDGASLEAAFGGRGDEMAGAIVEPVAGNMGLVEPTREFLTALRKLTEKHGALLVFDEVMTGFRLALGGAQQVLGMKPDLTVLGK